MREDRPLNSTVDERRPLLPQQSPELYDIHQQTRPSRWKIITQMIIPEIHVVSPRYRFVPLLGCLIILFNESEFTFKQVAMIRAIEAMHCIEYYEKYDPNVAQLGKHIPETFCKTDEIQKLVAITAAFQLFFRMLCSMIGNLPLGWVGDVKGRKIVLSLHKINVMCSGALQILSYMWYPKVPIWTVYLSGIPGLIGGNFDLGLAMLFTSYTDIMVSEAKKTTLFYLTTCMQYPAQAIGPLVSGVLIDLNGQGTTPEVALFVGFACGTVSAILTIFFFPETIDESRKAQATDNSRNQLNNNDFNGSSKENNGIWGKLQETLRKPWHKAQNSVRGVTNMFLLSVSILASAIGIKSIDWFGLVQYPVIRFHWKFSQATIAVSVQAAITMVNYALLLPFYIRFNTQHLGFSSARTSLIIMLFSTLLLIAGSIVIGFSRTVPIFFLGLVVYTLGGGLSVATQVYISSLTDKDKLARTLAGLSVATIGGKLLASGLFSKILAAGLDDGREWMKGLPLFMSACLFILAGLAIIIVSIRTGKKAAAGHVNEQSEECG